MDTARTQRAQAKRVERLARRAQPLPGDSPEQAVAKKRRTKAEREDVLRRAWAAENPSPPVVVRPAPPKPVIRPDIHARFQAIVKRALEAPD